VLFSVGYRARNDGAYTTAYGVCVYGVSVEDEKLLASNCYDGTQVRECLDNTCAVAFCAPATALNKNIRFSIFDRAEPHDQVPNPLKSECATISSGTLADDDRHFDNQDSSCASRDSESSTATMTSCLSMWTSSSRSRPASSLLPTRPSLRLLRSSGQLALRLTSCWSWPSKATLTTSPKPRRPTARPSLLRLRPARPTTTSCRLLCSQSRLNAPPNLRPSPRA